MFNEILAKRDFDIITRDAWWWNSSGGLVHKWRPEEQARRGWIAYPVFEGKIERPTLWGALAELARHSR